MIPDVEKSLDYFIDFLCKSQNAKKLSYAAIIRYRISGEELLTYQSLIGNKYQVDIYKLYFVLANYLNKFMMLGWMDSEYQIIFDSAPIESKEFDQQILKSIQNIKDKIKGITLGTK